MQLPGGLQYALKPDDRAVYIGTLRYYRDDYNTITKVEIVNDYARAKRAFYAKFGTSFKLRAVMPTRMK